MDLRAYSVTVRNGAEACKRTNPGFPGWLALVLAWTAFLAAAATAFAAAEPPPVIESITCKPARVAPGLRPEISATVKAPAKLGKDRRLEITVIAVVTRPDHRITNRQWKETLVRGDVKQFPFAAGFDTTATGTYRIEYVVYSVDMRKRLAARAMTFEVGGAPPVEEQAAPAQAEVRSGRSREQERFYLAAGITGNALNPAGGATVLLWPFSSIGVQGSYTVGTFASVEGRIIARYLTESGFHPYIGAGWIRVEKRTDVLGTDVLFQSSGPLALAGIEIPLGRRFSARAEVMGARIKMEKDVVNGSQSASAEVSYAPVTFCASLVVTVF
ncbi:MAG: hypothetical protein M0042_00725 [Nitrospiraceae bacterium]|nr:hypothetical protein [Nitrospiraceae bacterium]